PIRLPRPTRSFSRLFLSRPRPPPSSTLFPYTTLFRSTQPGWLQVFSAHQPLTITVNAVRALTLGGPTLTPVLQSIAWSVGIDWRDRKSTRLNSSHSQISYAVFCLKKKNKNTP